MGAAEYAFIAMLKVPQKELKRLTCGNDRDAGTEDCCAQVERADLVVLELFRMHQRHERKLLLRRME